MIVGEEAVDAQSRIILSNLLRLDLGQSADWIKARVFGQGQWDGLQSIGETTESVLLNRLDLHKSNVLMLWVSSKVNLS